ncbi:MAG: hypothetical protein IRY99_24670 [Isosphaeraceae bacterium]|nr:hypothetical protein [Isosphaeraceae bacterium]
MRRLRGTVLALMGVVALVAFGIAALRRATEVWASATFTLAVALLSMAVVGALVRRGPGQAFWIGCAVPGWVYLALSFGPWFPDTALNPPALLPTRLLAHAYPLLKPKANLSYEPLPAPDPRIREGGPLGGLVLLREVERIPGGTISRGVDSYHFSQVGHALSALAFGLVGGLVGLRFAARNGAGGGRATRLDAPIDLR